MTLRTESYTLCDKKFRGPACHTLSGNAVTEAKRFPGDFDRAKPIQTLLISEGTRPIIRAGGVDWLVRIGGYLLAGEWRCSFYEAYVTTHYY